MIDERIAPLAVMQRADPCAAWRRWLDEGRVRRVDGQLVLLGYHEVRDALAHPDLDHWPGDAAEPFGAASRRWFSEAAAANGCVRTVVLGQLRPAWQRLDVEALVAAHIDGFDGGDVVANITRPLVWDLVARLFGPCEVSLPDGPLAWALPELARGAPGPWASFVEVLARGSVLAPLVDRGGLVFAAFLLYALTDNLQNAAGLAAHTLVAHPAFADAVASGPGRAAAALLRYDSPVQAVPLRARCDTTVAGVHLAAGDAALAAVGAAHRDPAVFDDAERPRLDADDPGPLSFGHGPLGCLGASLATEVLEAFAGRFARIASSLQLAGAPAWRAAPPFLRGPELLLLERR
jgi:cytochrome P450